GVVEHDVDAAEVLDRVRHRRVHVLVHTHVADHRQRLAARLLDLLRRAEHRAVQLRESLRRLCQQHHVRAVGRGTQRDGQPAAAAIEELEYYSSSVSAVFDVHCILAGNALNLGTGAQRQRWLTKVATGEVVGAFATTEPDASSDLSPQAVRTVATRTSGGWLL